MNTAKDIKTIQAQAKQKIALDSFCQSLFDKEMNKIRQVAETGANTYTFRIKLGKFKSLSCEQTV